MGAISIRPAIAQIPQSLTIGECYTLAMSQYPLVKQKELLEKSKDYSIENVSRGYLPQFSMNGQASYQSDVTEISIPIPNVTIPVSEKDQYRVFGELNQPLTDAIIIGKQKQLTEANSIIEKQKLEIELYKLKERINQLFFGILLLDDQLALTDMLKKDLNDGLNKANAAIANGVSIKSSADIIKAELLKVEQRSIELRTSRESFAGMLGMFLNRQSDDSLKLEKPIETNPEETIIRPELNLFDNQKKIFDIQNKVLNAKSLPRSSIFFQAGYGKPAFNLFSNEFEFYYIGGIRVSWQLSSFYTLKNDRNLLTLNQNFIDVQKETFLFNTKLVMKQQIGEIKKLQELIVKDNEIIELLTGIKNSAAVQLENGVMAASDYLRHVNAEDQAKQNLLLHRTQLLAAQYNYRTTTGN